MITLNNFIAALTSYVSATVKTMSGDVLYTDNDDDSRDISEMDPSDKARIVQSFEISKDGRLVVRVK